MKKEFIIESGKLKKYNGNGGDVVIPNGVTSIDNWAFYECKNLTRVVIPENITNIGRYAFCGCSSLKSIEIPNSVTSISAFAFSGCSSLISVIIPNNVISIGHRAFANCTSLISVEIPDSITYMGKDVFAHCKNLSIKNAINEEVKQYEKVTENRNHLATEQQMMNTSVIIRDFLQEKRVAASDIYRFLRKKKLSVLGLEKAKNQFIDYSIYGKETELTKEFFEETK